MNRLIISMLLAGATFAMASAPTRAGLLNVTIRGTFAGEAPVTAFSAPNAPFAITFQTEATQPANPYLTGKDVTLAGVTYVLNGKTLGVQPAEDGIATHLPNYIFQHFYVHVPTGSPVGLADVDVLSGGNYYTFTHGPTELGIEPGTYVLDGATFTNKRTSAEIASGTMVIARVP